MRYNNSRVLLTTLILFLSISIAAISSAAENYKIDPDHSTAIFKAKHLGVSNVYGRFNNVSGMFTMDEKDIKKSSVSVSIKVDDIDTHQEKRDDHLKSPDFFNSKVFNLITFEGRQFKESGADKIQVTGDLTIHGVKKSVTVEMAHIGAGKDPWGGYRSGYEGTFKIKRSDFGMKFMPEGIGDEITIIIGIEGIRQ